MAETFFGVSMIPMNYKDEVRQIKSELLCFLGHPRVTHTDSQTILCYIQTKLITTMTCQGDFTNSNPKMNSEIDGNISS